MHCNVKLTEIRNFRRLWKGWANCTQSCYQTEMRDFELKRWLWFVWYNLYSKQNCGEIFSYFLSVFIVLRDHPLRLKLWILATPIVIVAFLNLFRPYALTSSGAHIKVVVSTRVLCRRWKISFIFTARILEYVIGIFLCDEGESGKIAMLTNRWLKDIVHEVFYFNWYGY